MDKIFSGTAYAKPKYCSGRIHYIKINAYLDYFDSRNALCGYCVS
jgi:hypothetical protein